MYWEKEESENQITYFAGFRVAEMDFDEGVSEETKIYFCCSNTLAESCELVDRMMVEHFWSRPS